MLRVKVEPSGEDFWKLDPVVDLINNGAVGIIPTDTVYAILQCFPLLVFRSSALSRLNILTVYRVHCILSCS